MAGPLSRFVVVLPEMIGILGVLVALCLAGLFIRWRRTPRRGSFIAAMARSRIMRVVTGAFVVGQGLVGAAHFTIGFVAWPVQPGGWLGLLISLIFGLAGVLYLGVGQERTSELPVTDERETTIAVRAGNAAYWMLLALLGMRVTLDVFQSAGDAQGKAGALSTFIRVLATSPWGQIALLALVSFLVANAYYRRRLT